jgi:hypothetical protein
MERNAYCAEQLPPQKMLAAAELYMQLAECIQEQFIEKLKLLSDQVVDGRYNALLSASA